MVSARSAEAAPVAAPSRLVSVVPQRVADTRSALGLTSILQGGSTSRLVIGGRGSVPASATSVVVNLTVTQTTAPGFVTVWPAGSQKPVASNVNADRAQQTIANLATVRLSADGAINVYASAATHVIIDVFGYYEPATRSTSGRLVAMAPTRVLDTRTANRPVAPAAGIKVSLAPAVPASAQAAVLNVTITDASGPGFATVWSAQTPQPATSNVNVERTGQTIANQVVVPVSNAAVEVFSQGGGHVIVDVLGYFTGQSAPASTVGLFQPVDPVRILDTRQAGELNPIEDYLKPRSEWTIETPILGRKGIPYSATAVAMNLTAVYAEGSGFVTAWAAGTPRPASSNLNTTARKQVIANHAVVPVSNRGVSFYTSETTHLIADISGYYLGAPVITSVPYALPVVEAVQAHMSIPGIGLAVSLGDGLDDVTLDEGPMRWSYSVGPGELGTMRILGHRTSHGGPFGAIGELGAGSEIVVTSGGRRFVYVVTERRIVDPDDVLALEDPSTANLQLVACHPIGSVTQRMVVFASLVE